MPLLGGQLQFDVLLLGDRDKHLGKGGRRYGNGRLGSSGVGALGAVSENGGCTHKCNGSGKSAMCPAISAMAYGFTEYLQLGRSGCSLRF